MGKSRVSYREESSGDEDDLERFYTERESKINLDGEQDYSEEGEKEGEEIVMGFSEDSDDQELVTWGKNRNNYYSADYDAAEEEEKEAEKIQKKRLGGLAEGDFLDESFQALLRDTQIESTEKANVKDTIVKKKEELVKSEEFFQELIQDYSEKMNHVRTVLEPLLEKSKQLPTDQCFGFLKLKYHLFLTYCSNICFYMLLKMNGHSIDDHPVVERLVELRTFLEKSKALEAKLQPQIDRLLSTNEASQENPLSFKPRLESMKKVTAPSTKKRKEKTMDYDSIEEDSEEDLYQPRHIAPMFYDGPAANASGSSIKLAGKGKEEALLEKDRKQARLLRELRDSTPTSQMDLPEEYHADDLLMNANSMSKQRKEDSMKAAFEEENFTRLQDDSSRQPKERKQRLWNELNELNEFAVSNTVSTTTRKKPEFTDARDTHSNSDSDVSSVSDYGSESDIEDDISLDEETENQAHKKKPQPNNKGKTRVSQNKSGHDPLNNKKQGERRPVGSAIMKNRGLMPKRSKEQANPRVRQRNRFERAMKRIKGFKAVANKKVLGQQRSRYSGEQTGIQSRLSKSTHLKY